MAEYRHNQVALLVCDMWDTFCWSPVVKQLNRLAPGINRLAGFFRNSGSLIVHCPSGCAEKFHANDKARLRVVNTPRASAPPQQQWYDPTEIHPFPESIVVPDVSNFTDVYHRQHLGVPINQDRDVISEKGRELANVYKAYGIEKVYIVGIHLNGCILSRSFGVRGLIEAWNKKVEVVWDLTAVLSMGDQRKDLRLMAKYVEEHWCPVITSDELIKRYSKI